MKKITKLALVAMMLTASAIALTACNKVTAISVVEGSDPQLVFVQGQELDLSKGKLTVKDKKGQKEIPMNASGVSVSGYDKNQLGEQEIVLSYEGQKTTLKVNVVARFVPASYEKDYFVGEEFNAKKGRLTVTNNDGTNFTVQMNAAEVTVGELDSDAPATNVPVPVTYKKGDVEYSGTIPANVYAVSTEKSSFNQPRQQYRVYQSHETELKLEGSYITLKNADESLQRTVPVTKDMVSGFDLTKVTEAHKTTPLQQTLTATYAGINYDFNIEIYYSGVTEFQKVAESLSDLDWTGEVAPTISEADGELAVSAMQTYFDLVGSDKSVITTEEKLAVVRVATQYGYTAWEDSVDLYADAFTVSTSGMMNIVGKNPTAMQQAYDSLVGGTDGIYVYGYVLCDIVNEFADEILIGETTVGEHLAGVLNPEQLEILVPVIDFMLTMHKKLANVPANWTEETLSAYATDIDAAKDYIRLNYDKSAGLRGVYSIVSSWRPEEKDDYFEILYTYYYNTENETAINSLKDKYLPGELETIYSNIMSLFELMTNYQSYLVQTVDFVALFEETIEKANEIIATDGMYKDLFYSLKFGGILQNSQGNSLDSTFGDLITFIRQQGLLKYWEGALDNQKVMTVWSQLLSILLNDTEGYADSDEFKKDVEEMLAFFVNLDPVDQFAFLASSNNYYTYYGEKEDGTKVGIFVFDVTSGYNFYFANLFYNYYAGEEKGVLTGDGKQVFTDLLLAMEYFARKDMDSTSDCLALFAEKMEAIQTAYGALSGDDRATFDQYVGNFYERYVSLYETYGDPDDVQKTNLGDWADEFKALEDACAEVSLAQQSIEMQDAKLLPYIVIVASYGKAKEIEKNILQNAPAEIVKAYYYETYAFEKFNPELKWSLSSLVYYLGTVYDYYRINLSVNGQSLFDWYDSEGNQEEYDLPDFLIDVSDVLFTSFAKNVSGQSSYDKAKLLAIMQTYRNELSAEDKFLFKILDGNMNLYDGALKEFFTTEFGAKVNISTAAKLLVEAEQAYVQYAYLSTLEGVTQETLNSVKAQFKSAYESFLTEFNKLEGDDLTAFNDVLEEMKAYYQNVYDGLTA